MMHYIYTLSDPRTKMVRYAGKTNNLKVRLSLHLSEKRGTHKNNWLHQLKSIGLKPIMEVVEEIECANDEWAERERFWISHLRQLGIPLTNLESGGCSGKLLSEDTKRKISAAHVGMKLSPASIAKMIATKKANMTPELRAKMGDHLRGKKQSEATKTKRAAAMKGHVVSEETRRKISESNKLSHPKKMCFPKAPKARKPASDETRAKQRDAKLGKKMSAEAHAKCLEIAATRKGIKRSPEIRAKMTASKLAGWAKRKALLVHQTN